LQPDLSLKFGALEKAEFIERPNRFVAVCRLEKSGEVVRAHLADPGRMTGLLREQAPLYLRHAAGKGRKTDWSVILLEAANGAFVSVQSALVNRLTEKVLKKGALAELAEWRFVRREYPLGSSRWDFLLENGKGRRLLLEVKSVSLVAGETAMFPDGVTARGRRHLEELANLQSQSQFEAAVLFLAQRQDAKYFRPADHIDPAFGASLRQAHRRGVKVFARNCLVDLTGIEWGRPLSVDLS